MTSLRFCNRCVTPETRPDLYIDGDGVCNACRNYERLPEIDWDQREKELVEILEKFRSNDGSNYDCIIPVSGGKDSHYQVIKVLEFGMNPLCINAVPDQPSEIGLRNIENIKRLGVDMVQVTVNPAIRAKIAKIGLLQVGDISWAEHITIFTIPVHYAVQMNIPLIIWAENTQFERGGPEKNVDSNILDRRWLEEFGGLLGLRVSDLVGQDGIETKHLIHYTYPDDAELKRANVTGIFLGQYLPWDYTRNLQVTKAHGFETYPTVVEHQMLNYENLDNHINGIHEYIMYLKFGFGRASTQASTLIRQDRLDRAEALRVVAERDGAFPSSYLGKPLEKILEHYDLTVDDFRRICVRFTNKKLFHTDNDGNLINNPDGTPVQNFEIE